MLPWAISIAFSKPKSCLVPPSVVRLLIVLLIELKFFPTFFNPNCCVTFALNVTNETLLFGDLAAKSVVKVVAACFK